MNLRRFLSTINKSPSANNARQEISAHHPSSAGQTERSTDEMSEHDLGDLNGLSTAQRAALALELLPDFKESEPEKRTGPGRPQSEAGKAAARAALAVGVGRTSVETAIAIQKRDPKIIERMRSGELNVAQAARLVGLLGRGGGGDRALSGEKDSLGRIVAATAYGKGDKWKEAAGPLLRYLTAWERRGFEYRHVNPKEARRRLALIEELQTKLDAAKTDLEQRAHSATLTIKKG